MSQFCAFLSAMWLLAGFCSYMQGQRYSAMAFAALSIFLGYASWSSS